MARYLHRPGATFNVLNDPSSMPGVHRDVVVPINVHGLRGPVPRSEKTRVLCVGGSTTVDLPLGDSTTWCDNLSTLLGRGTWVGNAGRSGMRLCHTVLHVEEHLRRLPKV